MAGKRSAKRNLPAYDPKNNIGAVDRVRFAMMHQQMDSLTEDEQSQFERWKQIDDWIRSKRFLDENGEYKSCASRRMVRNVVMAKFNISWDTAERDIKNAIRLFTPAEDEVEYYRSVYIEDLETAAQEARARGKFDAYKNIMEYAGELRGFNDDPKEDFEYDKFETIQFIIEYNPEAIGLKTIPNKEEVLARWQKKKALSDRMADNAEEATYDVG